MNETESSEASGRTHGGRLRVPRWGGLIIWPVIFLLAHAAAPSAISELAPRHGWVEGRPSTPNLAGLVPVVAGFAGLVWCLSTHFVRWPRTVELKGLTPGYLLATGPYRWSRNPMYVSGMATWLGWALFYGSLAVTVVMVVFWSGVALLGVPYEERALEAEFGETYRRYKSMVPRWVGWVRPRP